MLWETVIKEHYTKKHGFFTDPNLEADDVVAGVAMHILVTSGDPEGYIICSRRKDLQQVPGLHYDYRKQIENNDPGIFKVSTTEAHWNFWTQMLTGDDSDNVAGVPGLARKSQEDH